MNTPTKIAKEAGITLFGEVYGGFTRFLFIGLLSRLIGAELLGLYAIANATTRIMAVTATFGLDRGILRFVSYYRSLKNQNQVLSSIHTALKFCMISGLLLMLIQIGIAPFLTNRIYHEQELLTFAFIIFAISLPFSILNNIIGHTTQGFKLLKYKVTTIQIAIPTVMLLSFIFFYYFSTKRNAIVYPILIAEIVGFFLIWQFLQRLTRVRVRDIFHSKIDSEIIKFSYPLVLITIIGTLMHWIDIIMLGIFLDSEAVGLYQPAVRTMGIIRMFLLAFNSIFSPMISELFAQNKLVEMNKLYRLVFRWILILAIPPLVLIMIFPAKVMLMFGPEFVAGKEVLRILAWGMLFQTLTGIGGAMLIMIGKTKLNLFNTITAAVVNIILNLILIPKMGMIGAAWGTFGTMLLLAGLRTLECFVIVKIQPIQAKLYKPLTAAIFLVIILNFLKPLIMPFHTILTLLSGVTITIVVYSVTVYLLKLDADDWDVIRSIRRLFSRKNVNLKNI